VDRETASRSLRAGFLAAGLALVSFGLAFYVTILYIA
jgi:hypothetical protein